MKNPSIMLVLGILAILFIVILFRRLRCLGCKKDLERRIKESLYLPVEILSGPFRILEKIEDNFLEVIPIGKSSAKSLVVKVPKRMWTRVSEGVTYFFDYDYIEKEIRFDSRTLQTELSDFSDEEMIAGDFRIKTKILKGILF